MIDAQKEKEIRILFKETLDSVPVLDYHGVDNVLSVYNYYIKNASDSKNKINANERIIYVLNKIKNFQQKQTTNER